MAVPSSQASARELVRKITKDHGFVSPDRLEQLESFDPELRREIEEALLTKDKMIGSSVLTLATNLYTSKARFIFELLQNADDNTYSKALGSGDIPYLSFRVHPRCIVVECNEDGFTDKNLAAICSIGKSSKVGGQGYIGEKGIGFKSVFMAASKVHIQSGAFSFSFKHKQGDSGMGMISPLWEEIDEELPSPLTRFTLLLHDDGGPAMRAKMRQSIEAQFEELQENLLLFMKNLKKLHVVFCDETSQEISSTVFSIERPRLTYAVLRKKKTSNGATEETTNLAKNENRTYSEMEEITRGYAKSQIILAFPLSESQVPIIEPQDLFVFLPVRPVGFKFLIQADFVTDANRQDVVKDSLRNSQLVDSVAEGFIKAVLQFCEHDTLRFQWMKYLPDKESKNKNEWRGLWLSLVESIERRLGQAPILFSRESLSPRLFSDLCRLKVGWLDEFETPLFDDESPGKVISHSYHRTDLNILTDYGLRWATVADIMGWVTRDLQRGTLSRIRSSSMSDDWHSRVARLLNLPFKQDTWTSRQRELKRLPLIPLADGTWASTEQAPIYFHNINHLKIPSNINLRLVARDVVNADRITLFENLGVKMASISLVRESIFKFHNSNDPDLETSKCHLEFLYLTKSEVKHVSEPFEELKVLNQDMTAVSPASTYMYIVNDDLYGPWELFRKTVEGDNPGDGAPGWDANFVHQEYFHNPPVDTEDTTWVDWFYSKLEVERYVKLQLRRNVRDYIQRYRPEKYLGSLQVSYQHNTRLTPEFIETIRDSIVLCRGNRQLPLKETFFPTTELMKRTEKFLGQGVFFPWLQLEFENDSSNIPPRWKSLLDTLQVSIARSDVDFALSMLKSLLGAFPGEVAVSDTTRLFELYDHIQERYWASESRVDKKQIIRAVFSEQPCIYIPRSPSSYTWTLPDCCIWDAPQKMTTKFVLKRLYRSCFCKDGAKCPHFSTFFTETLGIQESCTWQDYVEELKALKQNDCNDVDAITGIYEAINALEQRTIDNVAIRQEFEMGALIYASVDDLPPWHTPSQCIWSKAARLRGKVSLNEDYEDLERLFTQVLDVKQVDLMMAIDELKHTGSRPSVMVPDVKELIWTVNSLLSAESNLPDPSAILNCSIFPVRYPHGDVTCSSVSTEFFIVDREQLRQNFSTKVKFLDFSLEDVVRLRHFLHWARLQNRYLSECVKEVTSFPGEGASPISSLDVQIRYRAHPLLRIACHYNSPRSKSSRDIYCLYDALHNAKLYETDGIFSNLQVIQDGKAQQVESSRTTIHLDEDHSGLNVYLPRGKDKQKMVNTQQEIYCSHLIPNSPHALDENGIATIHIDNTDASILPEPGSPSTLTDTVPDGIHDLDLSDHDNENEASNTSTSDTETLRDTAASRRTSPARLPGSISYAQNPFREHILSPCFEPATITRNSATDQHYVAILNRVIAAGRRDSLPVHGDLNSRQQPSSYHTELLLGLRSPSQIERDCKVGAAGELYVFELLSHLSEVDGLPGFSRDNWKSNMRKYVTIHPEYTGMGEWRGRETSDITYSDIQSKLTTELIEKGYLPRNTWEGKYPNYFIEVKTTTSSCETPFYISNTIYVIFRVYWLGQKDMGLAIYLDPESLKRSGHLKFQSELWSVVPGTDQDSLQPS
ncbi:hypothetical protein F5B22DRAFT_638424 [Xylaria bambusicola]|uniref:uncharacterized protein n=1 Tax=Xylaria bambusicola TaxID=326684 RepID=UPI002008E699|nr:uncharacterized protein F5B22DRAFT_638424 [Xylaria bambusicola]KAI0508878.1 hypothetical protein F5B22DRAFT_638424 [Xylaria bambusicola]